MTRRIIMLMAALCLSVQLLAAPHPRPRTIRRRPHGPGHTLRAPRIPWQTIVAGGLTPGGVVFAYKVSDGIQKGTMEAARSAPETFIGRCGGVTGTVQAASAVCVLISIAYLAWRVGFRPKAKADESAPDTSRHDSGDNGGQGG